MDVTKYMVSEAAKKLDIQPNVLRHMEKELAVDVKKDDAGRRWYSKEDLLFFEKIKQLKGKGFQLRTIKLILPYIDRVIELGPDRLRELKHRLEICQGSYGENAKDVLKKYYESRDAEEEKNQSKPATAEEKEEPAQTMTALKKGETRGIRPVVAKKAQENTLCEQREGSLVNADQGKGEQVKELLTRIMSDALDQNNARLTMQMNEILTKSIANELEYQLRLKEEKEEARFRTIDKLLREKQQAAQQTAATKENKPRKSKFFSKNKIRI